MAFKKFTRTVTRDRVKPGTRVTYNPGHGTPERGMIKSWPNDSRDPYVVYKCGGDWANYLDYTGSRTPASQLQLDWDEDHDQQPLRKNRPYGWQPPTSTEDIIM